MNITLFYDFFINNLQAISVCIAAAAALISALATIAAFCSNYQSKKQYTDSIQPQLSMSLVEYNHILYLRIKNTGRTLAKDISIKVLKIRNNGQFETPNLDNLNGLEFELYPEEIIQGEITFYGATMAAKAFPQIEIDVSYKVGHSKKTVRYNRTVTYLSGCTEKIATDIHVNATEVEKSLGCIARASVRTANYLDGCQVASFDELNIMANHSLKTDIQEIIGIVPDKVPTRTETIDKALNHRKEDSEKCQPSNGSEKTK